MAALAAGGLVAAGAFAPRTAAPAYQALAVPVVQLDLAAVTPIVFGMTPGAAPGASSGAGAPGSPAKLSVAGPALLAGPVSVPEPASAAFLVLGTAAAVAAHSRARRR